MRCRVHNTVARLTVILSRLDGDDGFVVTILLAA